jgi:hypothetical protein
MGTTANYSIPYPEPTDFVSQGAAAIEAVADGFDPIVFRIQRPPINTQTGTTYTLAASDAGQLLTLNNAAAITLTVPTNSTAAFPVGERVDVVQLGAGTVTVAAASGVTVNSKDAALAFAGQYAAATLYKIGTNSWLLIGSVE